MLLKEKKFLMKVIFIIFVLLFQKSIIIDLDSTSEEEESSTEVANGVELSNSSGSKGNFQLI